MQSDCMNTVSVLSEHSMLVQHTRPDGQADPGEAAQHHAMARHMCPCTGRCPQSRFDAM